MTLLSQSPAFGKAILPRGIFARTIPLLVGMILLTAAALKTHQFAAGPMTTDVFFTSDRFLIPLVEFELALGLLLLSGAYPKQARLAALAVFAGFCLVSLYQALTGAPSCGCFGNWSIKPWYTLLLDLAVVAVLWRWDAEAQVNICWGGGARNTHSHYFRAVALGLLFLLVGIPAAIAMSSARPPLLQPSTPLIDFGTMPQAERGEIAFWLHNPSRETVEIAKTKSSCDCLRVELDQQTVAGGERIRAVARLELDKEPRFTGELQMDIQGMTSSGAVAFSLRASVRVVRK
ncbi:MAG TPA: MauE/DoxX family redox-associated membrane protein [Gemmataceae bacterium]|nr:MauE/DoxX family redox-associated membrane protein [Gemmataceae bacterium]